ncbi:DUF2934 domain-containing protein [Ensifer sp. P24N7]|uniref:DUF2934 domain-containing protein n=1 Tax=Sinorhizobium sp. P24N7 TaxID=3348358 RepID=UPI0035F45C14
MSNKVSTSQKDPVEGARDVVDREIERQSNGVSSDNNKGEGSWEERVWARAYRIWEQSGRPEGQQDIQWEQACREIEAEDAASSGAANSSGT